MAGLTIDTQRIADAGDAVTDVAGSLTRRSCRSASCSTGSGSAAGNASGAR